MENNKTEVIELNENNCKEYTEAEFWAELKARETAKKESEKKDEPIKKGDNVNMHGYSRAGRGCKQVKHICGEVIETTEKAICVRDIVNNNWVKIWVPKSAIYNIEKTTFEIEADLKSWFVKK